MKKDKRCGDGNSGGGWRRGFVVWEEGMMWRDRGRERERVRHADTGTETEQ